MSDMQCCPLTATDSDNSCENNTYETRAKERVKCVECYHMIAEGEAHKVLEVLYSKCYTEEEMQESALEDKAHPYCLVCYEIAEHFGCEGWTIGNIWEDIASNFFPNMTAGGDCMHGLSPAAKGTLFDVYINWLSENGYAERDYYCRELLKAEGIAEMRELLKSNS